MNEYKVIKNRIKVCLDSSIDDEGYFSDDFLFDNLEKLKILQDYDNSEVQIIIEDLYSAITNESHLKRLFLASLDISILDSLIFCLEIQNCDPIVRFSLRIIIICIENNSIPVNMYLELCFFDKIVMILDNCVDHNTIHLVLLIIIQLSEKEEFQELLSDRFIYKKLSSLISKYQSSNEIIHMLSCIFSNFVSFNTGPIMISLKNCVSLFNISATITDQCFRDQIQISILNGFSKFITSCHVKALYFINQKYFLSLIKHYHNWLQIPKPVTSCVLAAFFKMISNMFVSLEKNDNISIESYIEPELLINSIKLHEDSLVPFIMETYRTIINVTPMFIMKCNKSLFFDHIWERCLNGTYNTKREIVLSIIDSALLSPSDEEVYPLIRNDYIQAIVDLANVNPSDKILNGLRIINAVWMNSHFFEIELHDQIIQLLE